MGDIIQVFPVRSTGKGIDLRLYFDNGSPFTFVKLSVAKRLGGLFKLPKSATFHGLGDGAFVATHIMSIEVKLLDIWCRHLVYVVADKVLSPNEDILIGHDFTQRYDIKLDTKRRQVIIDRNALLRAQKIRTITIKLAWRGKMKPRINTNEHEIVLDERKPSHR